MKTSSKLDGHPSSPRLTDARDAVEAVDVAETPCINMTAAIIRFYSVDSPGRVVSLQYIWLTYIPAWHLVSWDRRAVHLSAQPWPAIF